MTKLFFSFGRPARIVPDQQLNIFASSSGRRRNLPPIILLLLTFCGGVLPASAQTVPLPNIPTNIYNITKAPYNAVGDGVTTNTAAIQAAITACTSGGGGTILVPAGIYICGPITLGKSDNLQLASGALLRMLPFGSYPVAATAFITASSLTDVEISGSGAIDGQGTAWQTAFAANANLVRPVMLNITKCTRAAVLGVSFTNAATMHITAKNNTSFTMQGTTVFTTFPTKNTDGIDLAAVGAYVNGDSISDGDDVIALGSSGSFTGNIFITNCAFGNGHGLSMGSNTGGGVSNVTAINCTFNGTQYGLKGKSDRTAGGLAQQINYINITLNNIQFPISFTSYYPDNPSDPSLDAGSPITSTTPFWNNIAFSNITATAATGFAVGSLWGLPEAPISNMVMRAVTLNGKTGLQVYHVRSLEFGSDCSINVQSGARFFTYDAQMSSQLQLGGAQNRVGIVTDGTSFSGGGLDGIGNAYSAGALGSSISPGGFLFNFGAAGSANTISAAGQTLAVPAGLQANYQTLMFLGAGVNGNQSNQLFTVQYTDGTSQTFVQSMSDWGAGQGFAGESVAAAMNKRDAANGSAKAANTQVYEYTFVLQSNKLANSLTLPNNSNVVVLGNPLVAILPVSTTPTLISISNVTVSPRTTSAILSWTTTNGAASRLFYGTTPACNLSYPLTSPTLTNQAVLLVGLTTNTTYYYEIVAASGNNGAISTGTFSTDIEVIMQSSQGSYSGVWVNDSSATDRFSTPYKFASVAPAAPQATATFVPNIPVSGLFDVYLWYSEGANRSSVAPVTASYQGGVFATTFDETVPGGQWQLITSRQLFAQGSSAYVQLGNITGETNKIVIADAVRWIYSPGQDLPVNGVVPSWWTSFYFNGVNVNSSAPGANGRSLLANYVLGLSPLDPKATLSFGIQRAGQSAQAVFTPCLNGRLYQLQSTTELANPVWTNVPNTTVVITNGQGLVNITNNANGPLFYRLSVQMTP
jgi:polygalacturonase